MVEAGRDIRIVGLVGRPFSGKDSQASRFAEKHSDAAVVSPGDLLRDQDLIAANFSSQDVALLNRIRNAGGSVPTKFVATLMLAEIDQQIKNGKNTILLAGWPRQIDQERLLNNWFNHEQKEKSSTIELEFVHFRIGRREANKRRLARLESQGRADDRSMRSVRKRHFVFETKVWPMLAYVWATGKGRRIIGIDARQSKDNVEQQFTKALTSSRRKVRAS